jgi:hypothetical protein
MEIRADNGGCDERFLNRVANQGAVITGLVPVIHVLV